MPFIEDWITHPMTIINRFQEKSPETFERDVRDYFEKQIADPNFYREIPSINDRLDNSPLPSGCLVRYRAMVQDMSDDEIYCSTFQIDQTRRIQIEFRLSFSSFQSSIDRSSTNRYGTIGKIHRFVYLSGTSNFNVKIFVLILVVSARLCRR